MIDSSKIATALAAIDDDPASQQYFYGKLTSTEWLSPLAEQGAFSSPPMLPSEPGSPVPPWPAAQYLTRMASVVPEQVADVILETIPPVDNFIVQSQLLRTVINLIPEQAVRIVPRVLDWTRDSEWSVLHELAADLIEKLASSGYSTEALEVVRSVLKLHPDSSEKYLRSDDDKKKESSNDSSSEDEYIYRPLPQPQTHLRPYDYQRFLNRTIPAISEALPLVSNKYLIGLLDEALAYSVRDADSKSDYSFVWFSDLSTPDENGFDRLIISIAHCLISEADKSILDSTISVDDLVSRLRERSWLLMRRIALHLINQHSSADDPLVLGAIADPTNRTDLGLKKEYRELVREKYSQLPQEAANEVISWLSETPSHAVARERLLEWDGTEPSEEMINNWIRGKRRDKLGILSDQLPDDMKSEYDEIIAEIGESPMGDFVSTSSSWVGEASPLSAAELAELSDRELIGFLLEWEPPKDDYSIHSPKIGGLRSQLKEAVKSDRSRFAQIGPELASLDSKLLWGYLDGFTDQSEPNQGFDWTRLLTLLDAIAVERLEPTDNDTPDDRQLKMSVLGLIEFGMSSSEAGISLSDSELIFAHLLRLAEDRDPKFDGTEDPSYEPAMASLNTVRSRAISGLIQHTVWLQRLLDEESKEKSNAVEENEKLSEVLIRHLDGTFDQSAAVRAVYGRWFNTMWIIDQTWTESHVEDIFGQVGKDDSLGRAAWDTYLTLTRPILAAFPITEPYYKYWIGQIKTLPDGDGYGTPRSRLIQHIVAFYWHGYSPMDDPDSLISGLMQSGSAEDIASVTMFIGQSLDALGGSLQPEVKDRLVEFWENRRKLWEDENNNLSDTEELQPFVEWINSSEFDDEWIVDQLTFIAQQGTDLTGRFARSLGTRLIDLASKYPLEIIQLVSHIIENSRESWGIYTIVDEIKQVIQIATNSDSLAAKRTGISVAETMFRRGNLEFKSLLETK